ncbi:hypothetical protein [Rhodococcus sp. JT-3]|uniref:hypothetical protein n=1 Tax=Rhodococcus sp. JT-3 TaxID=1973213 RepID=UPI0013031DF0|nr:hypothetical protein [Rhodococcus sp. JT-3]
MTQHDIEWTSGASGEWGRQVPIPGGGKTVGYEVDSAVRLVVEGRKTAYFRAIFTGQDRVAPDGSVPSGFAEAFLEDMHDTANTLVGHIDWFLDNGQDRGTLTLHEGTGTWRGVSGTLALTLYWGPLDAADSTATGSPVKVMGFTEGSGQVTFPD